MSDSPATPAARVLAPIVLVVAWAIIGILNAASLSLLETLNVAALLIAMIGVAAVCGASRLAATAAGRLWAAGVFLTAALLLCPVFHPGIAAGLPADLRAFFGIFTAKPLAWELALRAIGFLAPLVLAAGLFLLRRPARSTAFQAVNEHGQDARATVADTLESFFCSRTARLNLAIFGLVLVLAGAALSGTPMLVGLIRGLALAAALLALRPLLEFAGTPAFARALSAGLIFSLALSCGAGAYSYAQLLAAVKEGDALLERDKPDEAGKIHEHARALNRVVCAQGPELNIETSWARFYEQKNLFWEARDHWNQVADMQHLDRAGFLPVLRVQCKLGDSATTWRRLVYQGFSAITDPELRPGIKALAETSNDVRAKLLAALLAWDLDEPKEERQRRLEDVQRAAPNEVTSHTLLARLGCKAPEAAELRLPADLLVGARATIHSELGTLEELGEVQTLVVLDPGHWEMGLTARGTPLDEEWPIIRVEFNGQEIGRTQVNRAKDYSYPFTFEVNQENLYYVKIVFENQREEMNKGHLALRGLAVNGFTFRRAP